MRFFILVACLGLALAAPEGGRIAGGEETSIASHPYMANLQHAYGGYFWRPTCGGSILNRLVVLTAAHCVEGYPAFLWRAVLGSSYATDPKNGTVHPVQKFTIHPEFNKPLMDNNIALVHLMIPAEFSATVQPARIPGPRYYIPDGTKLTAIGWGASGLIGWLSETLREVELDLVNQGGCWIRYLELRNKDYPMVSDGMMCAGVGDGGGKGTCQYDCGGPLVHNGDVVVGITSWNHECGKHEEYPSVFTKVSQYSDWIVANANA